MMVVAPRTEPSLNLKADSGPSAALFSHGDPRALQSRIFITEDFLWPNKL